MHELITHIKGSDAAGTGPLLSAGFFDPELDQDQGDAFQRLYLKGLIMHSFQPQERPRGLQGFSKRFWLCFNDTEAQTAARIEWLTESR